jgi:hypothetical protein
MRTATGLPDTTPDSDLFKAYLQKLSPPDLHLTRTDFLAQGADPAGKGDYQGCSEFNPLLIFSQKQLDEFQKAKDKTDRNNANAPNRRVVVLLFQPGSHVTPSQWPCPRATEGTGGCIHRFWSDGNKRRSRRLPNDSRQFDKTHDTFACRFYHRLLTSSPCEKLFPRVPAVLDVISDDNNDFLVSGSEPAATFVRMGIWDHAFDPNTGNLLNQAADAQNFIGRDSKGPQLRRFYLRVKDPNAAGEAEVKLNWRTEFGAGGTDDAPASQQITLTGTTADPSVFVSHALFLVSDADDQKQGTDSGLAAANPDKGLRANGQSNHRIRKIKVDDSHKLDSTIVAEYSSSFGGGTVKASLPVFERGPEERRRIRVHLVNVRATAGGIGALTAGRKQTAFDTLRSVYAHCGIYLDIDEILIDPPASCVNWQTRFPTSAPAIGADPSVEAYSFSGNNLVPSPSQTDVINVVRGQAGFGANDIYIVYVNKIFNTPLPAAGAAGLTVGPGGTSFPDAWVAANSIARSFVFVGVQTVNQFADPHEMTHMTTNLRNSAGGHFHLGATVNTGPGNIDGRNLMQRFALIANGNTADSKRLWDEDFTNNNITPAKLPTQIAAVRASRFVRPY